jgi:hypothetical protein
MEVLMRFLLMVLVLTTNFSYADDGIADLKLGCKDPGAFHNQLPPTDIKITCTDERYEWVPAGHDDATFHNRRTVSSRAVTSKPNVAAPMVAEKCDWPGTDMECGGVKEVCKTVEMEFSVTCDQILAMETINKFCQVSLLAETIATQEKIMAVKETGRTKKLCGVQDFINGKPITPISQR